MANSISKISVKSTSYNVEDAEAIKSIKYGSGSSYVEYTPDENGCVKLTKTVISVASPTVVGGVKISKNTSYTNIEITDDGIISAVIPIKFAEDTDGLSIEPDDDNTIQIPDARSGNFGFVKVSSDHHIGIETDTGVIYPVFGDTKTSFSNIALEPDEIDFETLYGLGTFDKE